MNVVYSDIKKNSKPNIKLSVYRVEWDIWVNLEFYKYHYMNEDMNKSCKCLLFTWNDQPVAFCGVLVFPGYGKPKYSHHVSRLVILPDFQGLGLSSKILDWIGSTFTDIEKEKVLYIKTIHPSVGKHLENSSIWKPTIYNGKKRSKSDEERSKRTFGHMVKIRKSYCYKYNGDTIKGYEQLYDNIDNLRILKANCGYKQLELF